jgi:chlorobactene glucosyltransferase
MELLAKILSAGNALLCLFLVVKAVNFVTLKTLGCFPRTARRPFVSILVPARNEETNIEACVKSLLAQEYPNFELIVLDDESEDATWSILRNLAVRDGRLRIIKGKELPAGWVGKSWACHQLSRAAKGEYLLFVDADTRHAPSMLGDAMDAALFYDAGLVTAMPRERAESVSEMLTIPLITWGTFSALPLPLAFRSPSPAFSITIGQFLLFRHDAYRRIGGHTAVADHITEDMELGRLIKKHGFRWRIVDGGRVVDCRMYTNFGEAVNGISKSIFGALNYSVLLVLLFSMMLAALFCLPPLLLAAHLAGCTLSRAVVWRAGTAIVLAFVSWSAANIRFRLPWAATLLYPCIAALAVFIFFRSMLFSMLGMMRWKGRVVARQPFRFF